MAWTTPGTAVAGEVLTASFWNSNVRDNLNALAGQSFAKNLLYNGAMQIAQRGTSTASITTSGYYTADRWNLAISALGTWTQSVENDAPTGSGFRKSFKMLCSTADASPAASDYCIIQQRLEGYDVQRIAKGTSSAQALTVSFWVKSNKTGTYNCYLQDVDNSRAISAQYTISSSATWEYKTVSFPADTTGAFDNDNMDSLYLAFALAAGSDWTSGSTPAAWQTLTLANLAPGQTNLAAAINNYWQVTGVQLETGSAATGFQFLPYGDDLRRCQRYFVRAYSENRDARQVSQNVFRVYISLPCAMRGAPSLSLSAPTSGNTLLLQYPAASAWYTFATYASSSINLSGWHSAEVNLNFTGGLAAGTYPQFFTLLRDLDISAEL